MPRKFTSEKSVKKAVKDLLNKYDWFWWMPPANGFGKSGVSDFNALKNGVFLAIETKFNGNTPTPLQKAYIESIYAQQGLGFVVDETNIEWLDQWLLAFDKNVEAVQQSGGGDPREAVDADYGSLMLNATAKLTELLK